MKLKKLKKIVSRANRYKKGVENGFLNEVCNSKIVGVAKLLADFFYTEL